MSGKGSKRRPIGVNDETFNANWEAIFSKTKKEKKTEEKANSGNSITAIMSVFQTEDEVSITSSRTKSINN